MSKKKNNRGLSFHAQAGSVSKVSLAAAWKNKAENRAPILTEPRRVAEKAGSRQPPRGYPAGSKKPLIGINCDIAVQGTTEYCFVPDPYLQCLDAAGAEVVILTPYRGMTWPSALLDGLVMIGGRDLDPRRDGYVLHRSHALMHPRREEFDRALVADAAELRLPLLAIGVGMQTLNVVLGGTLAYHLPEDFPKAESHCQADDPHHGHVVYARPDSLVAKIYPDVLVGYVRSQHHQAVDDVAAGFVATAWAEKNIVEAIESIIPGWAAIGVQWHPEFATAMATDRLLFEEFVRIAGSGEARSREQGARSKKNHAE